MNEWGRKSSDDEHLFAAGEVCDTSEPLLTAFFQTSAIGFAVLDKQLRYQAMNNCLANINGLPPQAHLGVAVDEIFGELSEIAMPSYHRALADGESSQFEVANAVLPTRTESRYWGFNANFPIRDRAGAVSQIGILVIELTQQRKLELFLGRLAAGLAHTRRSETFCLIREIQDSIKQYRTALAMNLDILGISIDLRIRRGDISAELLAQSVQVLDERILGMARLVSTLSRCFPGIVDRDRA